MAARASTDENQAIDTLFHGFLCMPDADHVVKHQTAVGVNFLDDLTGCPKAGDDQRHFVLDAQGHIVFEAIIGGMDDLIDGKGPNLVVGTIAARLR